MNTNVMEEIQRDNKMKEKNIGDKMHEIFQECKTLFLENFHQHQFDYIEQEEKAFFLSMSNFFLQFQQKTNYRKTRMFFQKVKKNLFHW